MRSVIKIRVQSLIIPIAIMISVARLNVVAPALHLQTILFNLDSNPVNLFCRNFQKEKLYYTGPLRTI